MQTNRWVNQSQPQTLFSATIMMYIQSALAILFGGLFVGGPALYYLLTLVLILGPIGAGLGIANEKKWGYWLAIVLTAFQLVDIIAFFNVQQVIRLLIYLALMALLLHPMSRSYYKTWFR